MGMYRMIRSSVAFFLGSGLWIGMGGCSPGEGGGPAQPTAVSQASNPQSPKSTAAEKARAQATEGERTTPIQRVDTQQLTEVVKEEVKGGEATEGPTPFDYLWMPAKP